MTRKEAIEILKKEKHCIENECSEFCPYRKECLNSSESEYIKACELAISSLEADEAYQLEYEKPEFCREITLEDVKGYCKPRCLTIITNELLYELTHPKIKALKQEPKTGHWKDIPKYKDIAWYCSECERFTTMKHNYCPKCGAKMVEPQESEDT